MTVHKTLIAHQEITEEYVIAVLVLQATLMALLVPQVRYFSISLLQFNVLAITRELARIVLL